MVPSQTAAEPRQEPASSHPGPSIALGRLFGLVALESHYGLWKLQAALGTQTESLGSPDQLRAEVRRPRPAPCPASWLFSVTSFPQGTRSEPSPRVTNSVWGRHSAQVHRPGGGGGGGVGVHSSRLSKQKAHQALPTVGSLSTTVCEQPAVCTLLSTLEMPLNPEAVLKTRLKGVRSSLEGRGS